MSGGNKNSIFTSNFQKPATDKRETSIIGDLDEIATEDETTGNITFEEGGEKKTFSGTNGIKQALIEKGLLPQIH